MTRPFTPQFMMARTVGEAVSSLAAFGSDAEPFAGGTWIMRAPIRGEPFRSNYVGLFAIPELKRIVSDACEVRIGACATHIDIVDALNGDAQCRGLTAAAMRAANPSIRQMATLGGSLNSKNFAASDLIPALLCLDAVVDLQATSGPVSMPLQRFLEVRGTMSPGTLVTGVTISRKPWKAGHAGLPLRRAGDYPVVIVSMAVTIDEQGAMDEVRIAVGAAEPSARRWSRLEEMLSGRSLSPRQIGDLAEVHARDFKPRDNAEASAWYRLQVLPVLVERAAAAVLS